MTDDRPITVKKLSMYLPVAPEFLVDPKPFADMMRAVADGTYVPPPTIVAEPPPLYGRLLEAAAGNPMALELLELHKPKQKYDHLVDCWECEGDEYGGYEGEAPDWPCETVGVIASHLGVEVHE